MDLGGFTEEMKKRIAAKMGEDYVVERCRVLKNNGVQLEGISVRKKGNLISPNLYMQHFYQRFLQNEPLEELVDDVIFCVEQKCRDQDLDIENFADFEKAKERIAFKLINFERNWELLQNVPYERFMDLAKVYYYLFPGSERGQIASVLISYEHLSCWGISEQTIKTYAARNTPRLLPPAIIGMRELFAKMMKKDLFAGEPEAEFPMYVMSNDNRVNGAATMAYPDTIRNFAKTLGTNLYVIPSSIHEVILIPENGDTEEMNRMVSEVNRTALDPMEVLADHIYFYDRKDNILAVLQ